MRLSALLQSLVLLGGIACGGSGAQFEEAEDSRARLDEPVEGEDPPLQPEGPFALAYVDWKTMVEGGQARPTLSFAGLTPGVTRVAISTYGGITGAHQLTVSPDGTKLAFVSYVGPDWALFVLDLATAEVTKLATLDGGTIAGQPSWRSDSAALAYVSATTQRNEWTVNVVKLADVVGVVDVLTIPPPQVVATIQVPDGSAVDCIAPAWSPAGTRLAFGAFAGAELEGVLSIVDPTTDGPPVLYNPAGSGLVCQPEWSSDGTRLVATERGGTFPGWRIVSLSADLTTATPLHSLVARDWPQTQWSPDGTTLAFVDLDAVTKRAALYTLRLIDSTVTSLAPLHAGMSAGQPQWSPDGAQLTFVDFGTAELAARVRVIPAEGGEASTVTVLNTGTRGGHPVWLPRPISYAHELLDIQKLPPKL